MNHPKVVADTIAYLEMSVQFKTEDWNGLKKYVHFSLGDEHYSFELVDDKITQDMHLDLPAGEWEVYIHGALYTDAETVQRITTEPVTLYVYRTGSLDGEPFPELSGSVGEKVIATSEAALAKAEEAYEASKLVGSPIVDVEALPTENINNTAFYRTSEGVYWYDGAWNKVVDENNLPEQEEIVFDGEYNAESNKAATVETVIRKVAEIVANAPEDFNTLKELSDWLITHGAEAAEMNSAIKANTDDIAEVKEGLTSYVKKTDMATYDKAGVIKLGSCMTLSNGQLYFFTPTDTDFKKAGRPNDHLRVSNTDQIVKYGLTDCRIAWTDDTKDESGAVVKGDKTKARELIGAVGVTDYAQNDRYGLVKLNQGGGFRVMSSGQLYNPYASENDFKNKAEAHFLRPAHAPLIAKYGIIRASTESAYPLSDTEKSSAAKWLGVPNAYEVENPEMVVDIPFTYTYGSAISLNPDEIAYLVSDKTFTKEELLSSGFPFYFEAQNASSGIKQTFSLAQAVIEEGNGYVKIQKHIDGCDVTAYVVYDNTAGFVGEGGAYPPSNGIYFVSCSWHNYRFERLYRDGKGIKTIDNKYLDLANHPVIKDILSKLK